MAARVSPLPSPGEVIAGRYRVEQKLGEGGMAIVLRVRHTQTDMVCALKYIRPERVADRQIVERFLKEARVAGRIPSHPNIVRVFDAGVDELRRVPFIAMELIEGPTLSEYAGGKPLPWGVVADLLRQLADALDEAHRAGIVHRDLKPSNLVVLQNRKAGRTLKVLDFGIAKVIDNSAACTATAIGTPQFCAPEQLGPAMREPAARLGFKIAKTVSPATDIWAMGLIAYELFTGYDPGQYWNVDGVAALMAKIALAERERPSARAGARAVYLPPSFDDWLLRCLHHDADQRWPSATCAFEALNALLPSTAQAGAAVGGSVLDDETTRRIRPPAPSDEQPTMLVGRGGAAPNNQAGAYSSTVPVPQPGQLAEARVAGAASPTHWWQRARRAALRPPGVAFTAAGAVAVIVALGATVTTTLSDGSSVAPGPASSPADSAVPGQRPSPEPSSPRVWPLAGDAPAEQPGSAAPRPGPRSREPETQPTDSAATAVSSTTPAPTTESRAAARPGTPPEGGWRTKR
ncbi:MAG: protein kinase [Deltaproteobacteria bacterium]|nr:protein kinase [Deltaproteobacteria bacterium]